MNEMLQRILDVDMDFFLSDIAHWVTDNQRLDDEYFKAWRELEFRRFLEQNCGLSRHNPIPGRVVVHHDEAFHFWKELIQRCQLQVPFELTHIDAHSDTGLGDANYVYIMKDLLHYPINERLSNLNIKKSELC
ncbi:hypothetical protein [Cohnella rhizosphaerae]